MQYTTQFIGTRRGYDATHKPITLANGTKLRVTHRYSAEVGQVLASVNGPRARYALQGDEIYVRAKIVSSKPQKNGTTPNARRVRGCSRSPHKKAGPGGLKAACLVR